MSSVDDTPSRLTPGQHRAVVAGLIALGLLCWLALHYPLAAQWHRQSELESYGIPVQARFLDKSQTKLRFADSFTLRYEYRVAGKSYRIIETVDRRAFDRTINGAYLDIVHDPDDPSDAMIVGNDQTGSLLWIYAAINAALLLAAYNICRSVGAAATPKARNPGSSN